MTQWFVRIGSDCHGPMDEAEVFAWIDERRLGSIDHARKTISDPWIELQFLDPFIERLANAPVFRPSGYARCVFHMGRISLICSLAALAYRVLLLIVTDSLSGGAGSGTALFACLNFVTLCSAMLIGVVATGMGLAGLACYEGASRRTNWRSLLTGMLMGLIGGGSAWPQLAFWVWLIHALGV